MTVAEGLGAAASKGAVFIMLGQTARILVQLASVVVLSRLLEPADFGLVAMVVAVVGVSEIIRDFGLSHAAVQARTLSQQQQTNLFWLNTAIGAVLSALVFVSSWPIASFYGDERLIALTQVISPVFLFNGLATQYRAQLSRELKFLAQAFIDVSAQIAALAAATLVALNGGGYWSLAVQQLAAGFMLCVLLVVATRWVPGLFRRKAGTVAFLKFGGFLALAQLVTYASKNVDSIVIGARLGPTDLGLYNRAFQILLIPLNQINAPATRVALPVLARLQDERSRFEKYLLTAQSILLQPTAAGLALCAALAQPLILIVLGPGWEGSVPIFQILAISGVFQAASYATYWVFLAHGLTKSQLYWALASRPFIIIGVIVGSIWGVHGVAWGYTISTALAWPAGLYWIRRAAHAPSRGMLMNGLRALIAYGTAGTAALLVYRVTIGAGLILEVLLGAATFCVTVAAIALLWRGFRADLLHLRHLRIRRSVR